MPDSKDDMAGAVLERYRQLCVEHDISQQNIKQVQAHQQKLIAQINDCFAAARLFGFDLLAEFQRENSNDPDQLPLQALVPVQPLSPVSATPAARGRPKIKDLVLEAVEKKYPEPVKASDISRDLANKGYIIHAKTPDMTLQRWRKDGFVRQEGVNWYFVPPEMRKLPKINGSHRSLAGIATARMQ